MEANEANGTIASYMGGPYMGDGCFGMSSARPPMDHCKLDYVCSHCEFIEKHYLSLDALVPVWDKLQLDFDFMLRGSFVKNNFKIYGKGQAWAHQLTDTIQEAAAIATAKAILELEVKNRK